ncbi:MAG: AMP-binding protein, partial [Tateyamaria sp.]
MTNPLYDALFGKYAHASTPFLHLPDGTVLTHADFLATAAQFAHVLTDTGLQAGDRLAAQIHKSPQALALYAACVQAGVVFLPLNTAYTADELSYFINDSGAKLVVCDG